jgi:hypothetical protein
MPPGGMPTRSMPPEIQKSGTTATAVFSQFASTSWMIVVRPNPRNSQTIGVIKPNTLFLILAVAGAVIALLEFVLWALGHGSSER